MQCAIDTWYCLHVETVRKNFCSTLVQNHSTPENGRIYNGVNIFQNDDRLQITENTIEKKWEARLLHSLYISLLTFSVDR